jgi:hypothetical protein
MNDKYLVILLILWFIFIYNRKLQKKIFKNDSKNDYFFTTRMKSYYGKGFNLIPLEDQIKKTSHYSHSIIPRYPPDISKYPLIKDAKVISITLEEGEALYIPACWWHWVRSEGRCFAVSNICEMHPIENTDNINMNISNARKLLSKVNELDNEKNITLTNEQKLLIQKLNEKGMELYKNHDFSKVELREIHEFDLNSNSFKMKVINSEPIKIKMEKWNISDRELANKLNKRELSVLVSTNSTITSLEKPDWNQENGVKPGVHVKNCNYLNYLKTTLDPNIYSYVGMSGIFSDEIGYKIPKFWEETFKGQIGMTTIWASHKNIETGLHYDLSDNILHVVSGRKKIFLFPPSETKYLYNDIIPKHTGQMIFSST